MNMASNKSKSAVDNVFRKFENMRVLVIGDVMLDSYLWGKVDRISPEAPVPVVSITNKEYRMGGAANVAINLQSLGATPLLCSVIGSDLNGRNFIDLIQQAGMRPDGIVQSAERPTTVKTRVIGNNHQMLRVDEEVTGEISPAERKLLFDRIRSFIENSEADVIIFEDYDKGVISRQLIEQVVKLARSKKIPVAVDPKKRNFAHYKNVTLFKPNLKELREGMKLDLEKGNMEELKQAVHRLASTNAIDHLLLTLSEQGVLIHTNGTSIHLPAHVRTIADVSGAGDTVISVAALCLAAGTTPFMM
ncbi:MAG: bifunctional heptose 7-phosphate kinase/heptose 1-phosphate adenyltransferase, partial [Bacteroidota bacterium]